MEIETCLIIEKLHNVSVTNFAHEINLRPYKFTHFIGILLRNDLQCVVFAIDKRRTRNGFVLSPWITRNMKYLLIT